jgi:hypothetical protein
LKESNKIKLISESLCKNTGRYRPKPEDHTRVIKYRTSPGSSNSGGAHFITRKIFHENPFIIKVEFTAKIAIF